MSGSSMVTPEIRSTQKPRKLGPSRVSAAIEKTRSRISSTRVVTRGVQSTNAVMEKKEKELNGVVLRGTIPDVVRWARERMDADETQERAKSNTWSARSFAQMISTKYRVKILLNGSISWRGESRLWENVFSFAAKLPCGGRANNIFDAMGRYPSSILVYYGLKSFFGRYVVIAGRKIPRLALRQNAISLFSPWTHEETIAKKWFEPNTFTRLQETVIHMSAFSEYVLRCVYISKKESARKDLAQRRLLSMLEERIQGGRDHKHREVLRFEPWDSLDEIEEELVAPCLESSLNIAHEAVIEGAKTAARLYGQKQRKGEQRQKIQLWMLRRPLPDIMDALVRKLEENAREVLGCGLDVDEFRLWIVRHLRRIEKIFMEVGNTWFRDEAEFAIPPEPPKKARVLTSSTVYTFCFSRSG